MVLRMKSVSKINAKSASNENITIDAKHNEMIKYFKELQKSIPVLRQELKDMVSEYKSIDTTKNTDFELIMQKEQLREKIMELKDRINSIVEKEEENKYFLEVGMLLHNYYENIENTKHMEYDTHNFEKNLLYTSDMESDEEKDDDEEFDDENEDVPIIQEEKSEPVYKSVLNFFQVREENKTKDKTNNEKDSSYASTKISDFVKEESVFKKKNILDEYLKKIDSNYISKIKIDTNICKCPKCKIEMILYPSDGVQICENCGLEENILIESDKPSFKDPPMEVSFFSYKRINHFNESTIDGKKSINESLKIIIHSFYLLIKQIF